MPSEVKASAKSDLYFVLLCLIAAVKSSHEFHVFGPMCRLGILLQLYMPPDLSLHQTYEYCTVSAAITKPNHDLQDVKSGGRDSRFY